MIFKTLSAIIIGMSLFIGYAVRDIEQDWRQQSGIKIAHEDCRRDYQVGARK